jgi:hypothetical protein
MKTKMMFMAVALFLLWGAVGASAQEKSVITVKGTTLNNGVVLVDIVKGGKGLDMQCNQGAPGCTQLKSGKYQLVVLPENMGMYECKDVQVFEESADTSDSNKKLGEYCLNDK